jgi:hypothetical protein
MTYHQAPGGTFPHIHYRIAPSCDGCERCEVLAHGLFARVPGTDLFRVTRQPETLEELHRCEDALGQCHMHVIRRTEETE